MANASQPIKLDLLGNTRTLILASLNLLSKLSFNGDVTLFFLKLLLSFQKSEIRMFFVVRYCLYFCQKGVALIEPTFNFLGTLFILVRDPC